jgi:NAD(P)-dependent dehydrogenase (short-subunit alcohol dehydrogenase family)
MRTALITGAYRGIGFEVAKQLAARDWRVLLSARKRTAGEKAAKAIGGNTTFVEMDVTDPQSIAAAVRLVDSLDVLVNNAAIIPEGDEDVLQVTGDAVLQAFTTNALGAWRVAQAFYPLLAKSKAPRIINVSSGAGQLGDSGTWAPAYSISKTALNGVTAQLAAALRDKNVAVNSVCPGWVRTEMGGPDALRSVEEGADTIIWLATEAPQELTGKFLRDRKEIPW